MENTPDADFSVTFYTGEKGLIVGSKNTIEFKIPQSIRNNYPMRGTYTIIDNHIVYKIALNGDTKNLIEPSLQNLYIHIEECRKRCMEVEIQAQGDPNAKYPIILKAHQIQSNHQVARAHSPPTSIYPSVNTFSSSVKVSRKEGSNRNSSQEVSKPPISGFKSKSNISPGFRDSRTSYRNETLSTVSTAHKFAPQYLADVGWCVQTPDRRYSLLFNDGVQLVVNPKGLSLEYYGDGHQMYF
jgi:hypothetical protein